MFSGKVDERSAARGGVARRAGLHRQAVRSQLADRADEAQLLPDLTELDRVSPELGRRPSARRARSALRGALVRRLVRARLARDRRRDLGLLVEPALAVDAGGRWRSCVAESVSGALKAVDRAATVRRSRTRCRSRWSSLPATYSFPSGHATVSFACATVLALAVPRLRVPLYALAALISFSRVYVGVHYPFDVLAGAVLGVAIAIALRMLAEALRRSEPGMRRG